ncbi:MAG: RNA polymerase sigma factor (sigma-70 family) [Cognaticolwellia sp.]|jgi:RNA polymerase sigma factor (sigma-70 family)
MEYKNIHRDIVEGCLTGNRLAQQKLYQLYSQAMYNICLRMLNNETDAEDLLQNSFVDVFTKLHYFRFDSSIGAWIKRIVINNCINFLKKKRLKTVEMDERDVAVEIVETSDWKEIQFSVNQVQEGIQRLPEGYRVVLTLYLLEGYDHKEIAEILNISPSTSKSQYSRAKKKLREILK